MRQGRRWCGWCMVVGILLFLWGASGAMAQTPDPVAPTYAAWTQLLLGLVIALIGAYVRGIESRVTKVEASTASLQRSLDREYHPKPDIERRFDHFDEQLRALHQRLDYLRVPAAFLGRAPRQHQDDGN